MPPSFLDRSVEKNKGVVIDCCGIKVWKTLNRVNPEENKKNKEESCISFRKELFRASVSPAESDFWPTVLSREQQCY